MSIISIHQPNYLPWLGYFYKIYQAEIFVFLDDVQFSKKGMHNYCYVKTPEGPYRLKYPVQQSFGDKIHEVRANYELGWVDKHLRLIEYNYKRARFFSEVYNDYGDLLSKEFPNIAELNSTIIMFFAQRLGIEAKFVFSSKFRISLERENKIIALCKTLGGKVYYSGTGAKAYQDEGRFFDAGLELKYSLFAPFKYEQQWVGEQSNVSALDYFMNCGYDWERVLNNQE